MSLASDRFTAVTTPDRLLRGAAAGILCGFLAIVQSTGFGLLLLVGGTQSLAPTVIGMALASTAIMAAVAAFTSSTPGVVAIAQGIPIAALTAGVIHILDNMGSADGSAPVAATIVAYVALASLAIGVAAFLLGKFRWGRFIRFVPFPVVGGFLAGSGWLILAGGIGVIAGGRVSFANLAVLAEPSVIVRLCATAAFVALVAILRRRYPVSLVLPGAALAAILLFNLVLLAGGVTRDIARSAGWLIEVAGGGALWPPIAPADIALVDWEVIAGALIHLPIVVVLTVIAVLMNATGIELDSRRDVDLDQELRSVGLQNLLGGFCGGMPGFLSVSLTALAGRLGAPGAAVGVIVSAFCVAALAFGDVVLALVPTPLLAGLLVWIGLSLMVDWLVRSYARLSVGEYLVIVLIFSVIVGVGFVWGIVTGLIAAAILFVVQYGRVEIVRHVMTGKDYQSGNDSSEERRQVLRAAGDAILIVRLQGFLFFGTADRLRKRIQQRLETHEGAPVRYLVVDFRRVSGLDSSTVMSFARLAQLTGPDNFILVLCGMVGAVKEAMVRGGPDFGDGNQIRFESDLDHGLEWCENDLIIRVAPEMVAGGSVPVVDLLSEVMKDRGLAEGLLPFLERVDVAPGETLIAQGTPSEDVYFIEQGRAAVELQTDGESNVRLATIGRGAIVGEMAFYLGRPRSASVIAEAPLVAWRFSSDALDRLRAASPEAAIAYHRGMAAILADRLTNTNRLVRLLAD